MKRRVAFAALLICLPGATLPCADEAPRSRMKTLLRALIAEDAKKAGHKTIEPGKAATGSPPATPAAPVGGTSALEPKKDISQVRERPGSKPAATSKAGDVESPTLLPQVEVRKSRITELDQKLAKQEQDIARERRNLQASEVDIALNDSKIARPLAIFGGESSQFRQHVASERVELMEAEKDLIEAIARAKTRKERQELQKQLNELKMVRRELEKSLR